MKVQCIYCKKSYEIHTQSEDGKYCCPICSKTFNSNTPIIKRKSSSSSDGVSDVTKTKKCYKCANTITDKNAQVFKEKIICKNCIKAIKKETRESMGHIAHYLIEVKLNRMSSLFVMILGIIFIACGLVTLFNDITKGLALEIAGASACAVGSWNWISSASNIRHRTAIIFTFAAFISWCGVIRFILTLEAVWFSALIPAVLFSYAAHGLFSAYDYYRICEEAAKNEKLVSLVQKKIEDIKQMNGYEKVKLPLGWSGFIGKSDVIFVSYDKMEYLFLTRNDIRLYPTQNDYSNKKEVYIAASTKTLKGFMPNSDFEKLNKWLITGKTKAKQPS
jgi:hypothetical protein